MTKDHCLGGRNKLYLTLHEVYCLHSENCQMGKEVRSFFSVKNKDQGGEKQKVPDWLGSPALHCLGWEDPGLVWCLGLAAWVCCLSGQVEHAQGQGSYLSLGLLTGTPDRSGPMLGLESYVTRVKAGSQREPLSNTNPSWLWPGSSTLSFLNFQSGNFWNWRSFEPP